MEEPTRSRRRATRPPTRSRGPLPKTLMETKRETSAGGVVYHRLDDGIEICLAARRTRRGDLVWGLPKGAVEDDESPEDAAIR